MCNWTDLLQQHARPEAAAWGVEKGKVQEYRDSRSSYLELSRQVSNPALKVSQLRCHRPLRAAVCAAQGWASAVPACPGAVPVRVCAARAARRGGDAAQIMACLPPGPQAVV